MYVRNLSNFDVDLRQVSRQGLSLFSFEVTVARARPWPIHGVYYSENLTEEHDKGTALKKNGRLFVLNRTVSDGRSTSARLSFLHETSNKRVA